MEEEQVRASDSNSLLSSHLGRVMNTLLSSRPKKLEGAISRLRAGSSTMTVSGSLEEPLCFLRKYVRDAVAKDEQLDQILIPMIETSLKLKESRRGNQVLTLLNWLFQDEFLFEYLATNLAKVIRKKEDHFVALGWCNLIQALMGQHDLKKLSSDTGIEGRHFILLKIFFPSISHLSSIVCNGSTLQGGFELPTRLAVAAADCILVLTETSTHKAFHPGNSSTKTKSSDPGREKQIVTLASTAGGGKKVKSSHSFPQGSETLDMGYLLWEHLDELVILVQKLLAWSRKSRPLHSKGLEQVLNWLQEIKVQYGSAKDEAGGSILKSGTLLLSSCWKHYSMLLRLEDHRFSKCYMETLNRYISGLQFYMGDSSDEHSGNNDGGLETRKFFLRCISLLLGRLDSKQFENAMSECGLEMSRLMLELLQAVDEDVIDGAVNILRANIFKENNSLMGSSLLDTKQMETMFPLFLNLLDERDNTARAVILLTAEYCSMCMPKQEESLSDLVKQISRPSNVLYLRLYESFPAEDSTGQCLHEVFKRLRSGNSLQRRNAIDVVSEIMRISFDSGDLSMQEDMAKNLLDRLGDEESAICIQASNLLPTIDPSFTLPQLVNLVYCSNERVGSSASVALVAVLKCHNQNPEVIVMLLDCLSRLSQCSDHPKTKEGESNGSKFDTNRILKLIPEWSKCVRDWNMFSERLVDKMFAEPSNPIIVRFLSCISENLAEVSAVVLCRILLHMQRKKDCRIDDKLFCYGTSGTYGSEDATKLNDSLFDRLCPLLIIRLLPLKIFDDLTSSVVYGELCNQDARCDNEDLKDGSSLCIATLLITRAFDIHESEDVRKLAAELCGRLHPQALFPIVRSQLEHASRSRDIMKMKACLFSFCTSLVLRGSLSANFPVMLEIREILETVLMWSSVDSNELSKAQHGCIDGLALMICAELQHPEVSKQSNWNSSISGEKSNGNASSGNSVLNCVVQNLIYDRNKSIPLVDSISQENKASAPLSFHMCMANVLISACQKIPSPAKKPLSDKLLPVLIDSIQVITDSDIRAACIQVLFSAVYHLKSAILPHSVGLLKTSIKALRKGSDKEKMASVKLMASLMASEDEVVESISTGLLEARSVLLSTSTTDSSLELRQICQKLLVCMASPTDNFLESL